MKKLFLVLILLMFCLPAHAKIEYAVEIPVNVEAENSVVAKEKALIDAQRQAFLEVAQKLVSEKDAEQLSTLSDDSIQYFIQSVGVENEKAGGTKYVADLTVQINERLLKDYLVENEMIKMEAEDLLIIPVYKANSYPILWEEDNLWRRHWRSKGLVKFGSLQMRTISDQFRNIPELSAENALYMPNEVYEQITALNGSDRIYVAYAEPTGNDDLKITLKNEKTKTEESFDVYNDKKDRNKLFDDAIEKSVMFISNMERDAKNNDNLWRRQWRSKGLVKFGSLQMRTISDQFRNIPELSAENALYMPNEVYEQITALNGSDRIYVAYAEPTGNDDLKITLKNEKTKTEESFDVYNDKKDRNKLFDDAIEKSVMFISNMERDAKNNDNSTVFHSLNAVYMYQDMKDWLTKSKVLAELEPVEGIDTQSFGGGKVNFSIRYTGSLNALWDALQENGFSHEAAGNHYIIR